MKAHYIFDQKFPVDFIDIPIALQKNSKHIWQDEYFILF
jgi:hypothetical protein